MGNNDKYLTKNEPINNVPDQHFRDGGRSKTVRWISLENLCFQDNSLGFRCVCMCVCGPELALISVESKESGWDRLYQGLYQDNRMELERSNAFLSLSLSIYLYSSLSFSFFRALILAYSRSVGVLRTAECILGDEVPLLSVDELDALTIFYLSMLLLLKRSFYRQFPNSKLFEKERYTNRLHYLCSYHTCVGVWPSLLFYKSLVSNRSF